MSDEAQVIDSAPETSEEQSPSDSSPGIDSPQINSADKKAAIKEMIRELELNVNGKMVKKKIDFNDIESLKREFQIAEANKSGMQKAAEYEKLYDQELKNMKNDPWGYLQKMGLDPDKMSEERILQKIEQMKKTPDQIAREERDAESKRHREEAERYKKELDEERLARSQEKEITSFMKEKTEALKEYKNLPDSPKVQDKIVEEMIWVISELEKAGIKNPKVNVSDVLPNVEARLIKEYNELLEAMPEESLEKYIGAKNTDRLRKKRLSDMKETPSLKVTQTSKTSNPAKLKEEPKTLARDFFRNLK